MLKTSPGVSGPLRGLLHAAAACSQDEAQELQDGTPDPSSKRRASTSS
jgi:hypothetical protein